jgi:hypothetical protein
MCQTPDSTEELNIYVMNVKSTIRIIFHLLSTPYIQYRMIEERKRQPRETNDKGKDEINMMMSDAK